ncbi:MAG: ABC-F family ATP-binding cassette domain-containing protein [Rikenellaceae bacterium]
MLSVDNVTVSFGGWDLFSEVSFLVNARDRIGLVGKNGAGKSTMLKIICGENIPTTGGVSKSSECKIGYLPQVMKVADDTSLVGECHKAFAEFQAIEADIERLNNEISSRTDYDSPEYEKLLVRLHEATEYYHTHGGDEREGLIERALLGLGFKRSEFEKATSQFSGGWRMRIELAKLLLSSPTLLLLDEPTNHLDIESIQWLEEYLKNFSGAVVLISHDKAFLDNVTNRTIELTLGKAIDYKAAYSHYLVLRAERRVQQMAAYENQQKLIEKTEDFIEKFRYKPTKSNQVQSRIKQLEKLDRLEIEEQDVAKMNIRFPSAPRSGQVVVEAKEAAHSYDGKRVIFSDAEVVVERGEKIALVGRNGEGKTTFIRAMLGEITASKGFIKTGYNVNVGYFAQNQDDLMDGDFTVYDTLDRVAVGDIRTKLRDILAAFLFKGEDIDKKVKVLSGGERSRLAMARLMLEPYNLLVLDEPTNHMDMLSKEILKLALQKYDGTVVVISHDREFLDSLVDTVYEFRDGKVKQYLGGIYDFISARKIEDVRDIERKSAEQKAAAKPKEVEVKKEAAPAANKATPPKKKPKNTFKIKEIEAKIEELETLVSELEAKLADASQYSNEILSEWQTAKETLDKKMEEWEKLME